MQRPEHETKSDLPLDDREEDNDLSASLRVGFIEDLVHPLARCPYIVSGARFDVKLIIRSQDEVFGLCEEISTRTNLDIAMLVSRGFFHLFKVKMSKRRY